MLAKRWRFLPGSADWCIDLPSKTLEMHAVRAERKYTCRHSQAVLRRLYSVAILITGVAGGLSSFVHRHDTIFTQHDLLGKSIR